MKYKVQVMTDELINKLDDLKQDALIDGYRIVKKTIDQWLSGENTFSHKQEVLYGVMDGDDVIAIGGINIDPYLMDHDIGRIRHIYVHTMYRGQGIATELLNKILDEKEKYFTVIRLLARNEIAMQLYESFGFKKVVEYKASHILVPKRG